MALREQGAPYQMSCLQTPSLFDRLSQEEKGRIMDLDEGVFRHIIFPMIDTTAVQKLYSDKQNVRPSCGVNYVAAMLYVKFKGLTEDYFVKHISYDVAMQYAVGTEDMIRQPFCEKTFQRMRRLFDEYEASTGEDLYDYLTHDIDLKIASYMGLSKDYDQEFHSAIRIDSLMIDCHGAVMTRIKIVYTVIQMAVSHVYSFDSRLIPLSLQHYLDKADDHRYTYYKGTMAEVKEAQELTENIGIRMETATDEVPDKSESAEAETLGPEIDAEINIGQTDSPETIPGCKKGSETNRKNRLQIIGENRLRFLIQDLLSARMMLERARETE